MHGSKEKDSSSSKMAHGQSQRKIRLEIKTGENLVSFKNSKSIAGLVPMNPEKTLWKGKPFIATNGEYKALMKRITQSIESALFIEYQTRGGATGTGLNLQSWIASSLPLDDSLGWIPKFGGWEVEYVAEGEEGFVIEIEEITDGSGHNQTKAEEEG